MNNHKSCTIIRYRTLSKVFCRPLPAHCRYGGLRFWCWLLRWFLYLGLQQRDKWHINGISMASSRLEEQKKLIWYVYIYIDMYVHYILCIYINYLYMQHIYIYIHTCIYVSFDLSQSHASPWRHDICAQPSRLPQGLADGNWSAEWNAV